ncbi:hypothetical protein ETD86_03520 [Nonomuraea turkmeniaca]|uniref:Uncharacterized protein n=1 Tax=Nonomuraea turkmeniaca TaxID=103838 RepID=A0A5S4FXF9_9ACTN|nr:hypothetical protein [Nonomuraea turkmeniaca]TMR24811.1 hypothetical protein ETD86_03520 [Nonomuraea turkmeniaca]
MAGRVDRLSCNGFYDIEHRIPSDHHLLLEGWCFDRGFGDCRDEDQMTDGSRHQRMRELPPPWPGDRYEVLCQRPAPYPGSRDQYHFAEYAVESARALEKAGLVTRVAVIRMADDTVIYDPVAGVELPPGQW